MAPEKILLSISVLVSNRPETVEKCLKSLDSLRRKVLSELILVDTGCGEQVRKIIEPYADKIMEFAWCNDFSKARNAGLEQARGEWFLYLDDDEWFENTNEIENFFLSGRYIQYNSGVYLQRNYFDAEGSGYRDVYVGRLFRLLPGVRFVYSIHEVFTGPDMPMARLDSYVHHYGYVYKDEEDLLRHSRRNVQLLAIEHEKEPSNLHHILQLAQEYNVLKEWEKSIEISWRGIRNAVPGAARDCILGGLYANIVRAYISSKQYEKAVETGERYLERDEPNELAKATVYCYLCIAYPETGEYAKSLEMAGRYEEIHTRWKEDRDAFLFYENLFTDYTFSENVARMILYRGVRCGIKLGKTALAKKYFEQIKWDTKNKSVDIAVVDMIQEIVRAWLQTDADEAQDYTDMMKRLLRDGVLAKVVTTDIDLLRRKTPEILQNKICLMAAGGNGEERERDASADDIVQELLIYAAEIQKLCRRLYREELFQEMPGLLPRECQFGIKLSNMAAAVENGNMQRALAAVKEALEIMPELHDALKWCTKWISEKAAENTEQEKTREEMKQLADSVKHQVLHLAAQGMTREALGILQQLRALVPEDEEAARMEKGLLQVQMDRKSGEDVC